MTMMMMMILIVVVLWPWLPDWSADCTPTKISANQRRCSVPVSAASPVKVSRQPSPCPQSLRCVTAHSERGSRTWQSHCHGAFGPCDVEPVSVPTGMAGDYKVLAHYFISPTSTMFTVSSLLHDPSSYSISSHADHIHAVRHFPAWWYFRF